MPATPCGGGAVLGVWIVVVTVIIARTCGSPRRCGGGAFRIPYTPINLAQFQHAYIIALKTFLPSLLHSIERVFNDQLHSLNFLRLTHLVVFMLLPSLGTATFVDASPAYMRRRFSFVFFGLNVTGIIILQLAIQYSEYWMIGGAGFDPDVSIDVGGRTFYALNLSATAAANLCVLACRTYWTLWKHPGCLVVINSRVRSANTCVRRNSHAACASAFKFCGCSGKPKMTENLLASSSSSSSSSSSIYNSTPRPSFIYPMYYVEALADEA